MFDDSEHISSEPEFVFIQKSRNNPGRMALLKLNHVSPRMSQVAADYFIGCILECLVDSMNDNARVKRLPTGDQVGFHRGQDPLDVLQDRCDIGN